MAHTQAYPAAVVNPPPGRADTWRQQARAQPFPRRVTSPRLMCMDLPPIGDWLDARDVKWAEDAGHLTPIVERLERRLSMRNRQGEVLLYGKESKCIMVHLQVKDDKHIVHIRRRRRVLNSYVRSVCYYEYPLEGTTAQQRRVHIAKCLMP